MGKNADGGDMLQHAPLGSASPVEVREGFQKEVLQIFLQKNMQK